MSASSSTRRMRFLMESVINTPDHTDGNDAHSSFISNKSLYAEFSCVVNVRSLVPLCGTTFGRASDPHSCYTHGEAMTSKLTLSINDSVVRRAKRYAGDGSGVPPLLSERVSTYSVAGSEWSMSPSAPRASATASIAASCLPRTGILSDAVRQMRSARTSP